MDGRLIRPATAADIPAITAIYRDAVLGGTATFEVEPPDEAEMLGRMQRIVEGGYPYLTAEIDGAVAGSAYVAAYHTRPAYRWAVEDSIYLAPEAQGRGTGGALLAGLIRESEVRGYRRMIAVIGDSDHAASIRLHRAAGFAEVGVLHDVGFKFGRWLDVVIMERALGAGATAPPTMDEDAP